MNQITKLSTFPRVIACLVMLFAGYMTSEVFSWIKAVETISTGHGVVVAAFVAPLLTLLKFAFDFAGDGKIDSK
jgi:hypothetical protein